jgi:hypothetical protein
MIARLNLFRLNAARLNDARLPPGGIVVLNGVEVSRSARIDGAGVTYQLNHAPDTLQLRIGTPVVPVAGQTITLWVGAADAAHLLFSGRILEVTALYEGERPALVAYDVHAIDPTWLINRQVVSAQYTNQSATAIAQDLLARFTRGFSGTAIVAGLPTIDEITFTNEQVADCFTRIAQRIGGYWYCDYTYVVHLFLDEGKTAHPITQADPYGSRHHTLDEDLSQVATKIIGRGGGAQAAVPLLPGDTSLPVTEHVWYSPSGGLVESGTQRITYTGLGGTNETGSTLGLMTPPAAPGNLGTFQQTGGSLAPGTYRIAYTYVVGPPNNVTGETTSGPYSTITVPSGGTGQNWIQDLAPPPATDPRQIGLRAYLTDPNGTVLWTSADPAYYIPLPVSVVEWTGAQAHGKNPPPVNTAGPITVVPGASAIPVAECGNFAAAGWILGPGGQTIRYTGRTVTSGAGSLTGVPPTGEGAVTAAINAGTFRMIPYLAGVPASGPGAIVSPIKAGDEIAIRYEETNTTAAHDMGVRFGGVDADGILEQPFSDGRFGLIELTATVRALLADRSTPIQIVRFESRDPLLEVGSTVQIDLDTPAIHGLYRIHTVSLTEIGIGGRFGMAPWPLRHVTATNKLFSFDDLVRRWRLTANPG